MRALRVMLVGGLAAATVLLAAPTADAAKSTKACKSLKSLEKELNSVDPSDTSSFDAGAFDDIGKAFHKAAKKAPKQVKSAVKKIGDFYDDLGNADSSVEALRTYGQNGEKFAEAISDFTTFYATACTPTSVTSG